MVKSNVHKLLIRHEEEPESQYIEFPVKPIIPYSTQRNDVTLYAFRDVNGTMKQKLVASIPSVKLEFKGVELNKALSFLVDVIDDKILTYGTKNFYLNIFTLQYGWIDGLFTLGSPNVAELVIDLSKDLSVGVVNFSLDFQAVSGFKIRGKNIE